MTQQVRGGGDRASWTRSFEQGCQQLIGQICAPGVAAAERDDAWRELVTLIGPFIERWAQGSFVLRRCGLAGEDDARTVMVNVLVRLRASEFANLARYLQQRDPGDETDRIETDALGRMARLAAVAEDCGEDPEPAPAGTPNTPLRAWLLTLVSYAVKDHVRQRLGWSRNAEGAGSKRDVNTNAERIDGQPQGGARPPITDHLTMQQFLDEVMEFVDTFPPPMKQAIRLWLQDSSFDEIADQLGDGNRDRARALVRSAKARLRERFRGDWHRLGALVAA